MTTNTTHNSHVRRFAGAAVLAATIGAGAWTLNAPSALAPEPAKLKAALSATAGATAAAYYVSSALPTQVRFYTGSWTSDSYGPAAGTPCSPYSLAGNQTTTHVIQVYGNYRRCI